MKIAQNVTLILANMNVMFKKKNWMKEMHHIN